MAWNAAETAKVDKIQLTVTSLAGDVRTSLSEVAKHRLAIDGSPANGKSPGLKGRVGSLEQSRRFNRKGLWALWVFMSALALAGVSAVLATN